MTGDAPPVAVERVAPDGRMDHRVRRVLIVEDEATLRRIVARNLAGRGLQVAEAESAESALGSVARQRPDLLLLDINLPDRTGWDVLRDLRQRKTEVPTIVISAAPANPNRLAEFHPLAYLPKPFPLEALLRLVFETPGQLFCDTEKKETCEPVGRSPHSEHASASPLRVAASMLSRAPGREMTATTVVGGLDRDDVEAVRALVNDIAAEYGLDATLSIAPGSFSVRFER